jgi:hypothetical protein
MLFICTTTYTPEAVTNVFNSVYGDNVVKNIVVKDKTYVWVHRAVDDDILYIFKKYNIKISNLQPTTCRVSF